MREFHITTSARRQFLDITARVREAVAESGVREGLCVVYCPHTTAAITINEHADPDVVRDIDAVLTKLAPRRGDYAHVEGNSDAHIQCSLLGPSQTLIIHAGRLVLGTWQGIFFCEFDGPRQRTFYVKILPQTGKG